MYHTEASIKSWQSKKAKVICNDRGWLLPSKEHNSNLHIKRTTPNINAFVYFEANKPKCG